MSGQLPYQPRKQRSRPERPLPAPPDDEADVRAINAVELEGGYAAPPSPPRLPARGASLAAQTSLPPPVVASPLLSAEDSGSASPRGSTSSETPLADKLAATSLDGTVPERRGSALSAVSASSADTTGTGGKRPRPPVPKTDGAKVSAQHLLPHHSTLPEFTPPTILTPLRAHYLKKTLVDQQISYELNLITDPVLGANALGLLGSPFVLPAEAKKDVAARVNDLSEGRLPDLPFLRYIFHQFVLPFPFLAAAPPTFWSAKVQPFLSSFLATTGMSEHTTSTPEERQIAESLMSKEERRDAEERRKLWNKAEKHLGLMIGIGIKLVGGEEVVRIGQSELRRIEEANEARRKRWVAKNPNPQEMIHFDVNVVGVRNVAEKSRVHRHKSHEEFIIRTQRTGFNDVFVSRRYGDFRRLAEELRIAFPDAEIANPPAKNKTAAQAPQVPSQAGGGYSYYNPLRVIYGSGTGTGTPSGTTSPRGSQEGDRPDLSSPTAPATPLSREKNRLTLRAYLQGIMSLPEVPNSPVIRSFLLSNPTTLTPPEAADITRRLDADAVREEGRKRFREEAERRVEALREGLAEFKGDVLTREGGLKSVFEVVRRVERVEDLPKAERSVLEWGRISLAATVFQMYVASDNASESLAGLKRLHGIMPYFVLKGILKISNPVAMIRGILDLFLARPFGGQSLLQRMFSTSLAEDVRYLQEDIQAVTDKIDDPVLCQKLQQYVDAPYEIQELFRRDAVTEGIDLLVVILRSPDMPILSRPQFQRVFKASRAYKEYQLERAELSDSDDDEGPDNDDAWLFEDLNILMKLMMRKKEKEALVALIFEGVTAELLKDIITIFYAPLAQVYKAASIADSLGDLQAFINDMIRTVEQVEELSQEDPQRTVQTFIDLVQRHEQAFYSFVHNVHSKGQGLFDSLMGWIELFLSYAREGLPHPLDLEILLPHSGPERVQIMAEVDKIAQYHYALKVAHEEKVRRRFQSGQGEDQQSLDDTALVNSVVESLALTDTTIGAAGEVGDEEEEEEDEEWGDDTSDGSSIRSMPRTGQPHGPSHLGPHSARATTSTSHDADAPPVPPKDGRPPPPPGPKKRRKRKQESLKAPDAKAIAALRPLFVEVVKPLLVVKELKP